MPLLKKKKKKIISVVNSIFEYKIFQNSNRIQNFIGMIHRGVNTWNHICHSKMSGRIYMASLENLLLKCHGRLSVEAFLESALLEHNSRHFIFLKKILMLAMVVGIASAFLIICCFTWNCSRKFFCGGLTGLLILNTQRCFKRKKTNGWLVWGDIFVSPRCPGGQNGTYVPSYGWNQDWSWWTNDENEDDGGD